jgi:hypothetical protein
VPDEEDGVCRGADGVLDAGDVVRERGERDVDGCELGAGAAQLVQRRLPVRGGAPPPVDEEDREGERGSHGEVEGWEWQKRES